MNSLGRRQKLFQAQKEFKKIEELYLNFAKKASAFNSWFENAEEGIYFVKLTDKYKKNNDERVFIQKELFYEIFLELLFKKGNKLTKKKGNKLKNAI